jgi:hypothetical protein
MTLVMNDLFVQEVSPTQDTLITHSQHAIEFEWDQHTREWAAALFAETHQEEEGWHHVTSTEYLERHVRVLKRAGEDTQRLAFYTLTWTVSLWKPDARGLIAFREVRVGWDESIRDFTLIVPRARQATDSSLLQLLRGGAA